MDAIPEVPLSSGGRRLPILGMGTASDPPVESEITKQAVLRAIEVGYRHFDTAALYFTEEPLGEAIAEALELRLIKSREELFITSKLWCSDAHPKLVLPALRKTLRNLKMVYVDLYLIHWPVSSKPGIYEYPIKKEDFVEMEYKSVWAAMEECQRLALAKAIGVCNFSCKKLAHLLATSTIPPAVNQKTGSDVVELLKGGSKPCLATKEADRVLQGQRNSCSCLCCLRSCGVTKIANARGKTVAQVCLRWAYEQGIGVLVKSFNKERMKQNLEIFNWSLSNEESKKIGEIPQSRARLGKDYTSANGPIKTIEELWDGEL
ncbi:hypothetical protein ACSBR1_006652 [Camellia fascicularis]